MNREGKKVCEFKLTGIAEWGVSNQKVVLLLLHHPVHNNEANTIQRYFVLV